MSTPVAPEPTPVVDTPLADEEPTITERAGWSTSGATIAVASIVGFLGGVGLVVLGAAVQSVVLAVLGVVLALAAFVGACGLTLVAPNEARVLQILGGSYAGTVRERACAG